MLADLPQEIFAIIINEAIVRYAVRLTCTRFLVLPTVTYCVAIDIDETNLWSISICTPENRFEAVDYPLTYSDEHAMMLGAEDGNYIVFDRSDNEIIASTDCIHKGYIASFIPDIDNKIFGALADVVLIAAAASKTPP